MSRQRKYFTVEQRRAAGRAKQMAYAQRHYNGQTHGHVMKTPQPEAETLIERERAIAAPRTIGQELCGDPLAGRSALDKRMEIT